MNNLNISFDSFVVEEGQSLGEGLILPPNPSSAMMNNTMTKNTIRSISNYAYINTGSALEPGYGGLSMEICKQINGHTKTELFCIGVFVSMLAMNVYISPDTYINYFFVSIIDKNCRENEVLIFEEDMKNAQYVFDFFSEKGIYFFRNNNRKRDLELLLNYLYSNIKDTIIYEYRPGWYGRNFKYYTEQRKIEDTPFFNKVLRIDENISSAKSALQLVDFVTVAVNSRIGLICLILLHYSVLIGILDCEYKIKVPVAIFGRRFETEKFVHALFQLYNRDSAESINLHDKKLIRYLRKSKDEVAIVKDYATSDYRRKAAKDKYTELKEYINDGYCDCLCVIISDCGVVKSDETSIHMIIDNINLDFVYKFNKDIMPVHILKFINWVSKLKKNITVPDLQNKTGDAKTEKLTEIFWCIFSLMCDYYLECANINLLEAFSFDKKSECLDYIKEFIVSATDFTGGDWMCELFRETYLKMYYSGKLDIRSRKSFNFNPNGERIIVLDYGNQIAIKSDDFQHFLTEYPENVRSKDVLYELRKAGVLITDEPDRYTKKKRVDGKLYNMIVIDKSLFDKELGDI